MSGRTFDLSVDADTPYLTDATLFNSLPTYVELVDSATAAETEWLNAKSMSSGGDAKKLLKVYMASLVPRRCRLSGVIVACSRLPDRRKVDEADVYLKIRLSTPSLTYRDRLYEFCYSATHSVEDARATIMDLMETNVGEEAHLFGWLGRGFCIPGFYLAQARLYRGPSPG